VTPSLIAGKCQTAPSPCAFSGIEPTLEAQICTKFSTGHHRGKIRENPGKSGTDGGFSDFLQSVFPPKTGRATLRWNIGKCPSVPVSSMGLLVANVELNKAVPSMVGTLATDFECTPDVMAILEIIPIFAPAKYLAPAGVAISCGLAFYSLSQELYPLERSTQCLHARWQRSMSWAHL
jgi:hypothetical protein